MVTFIVSVSISDFVALASFASLLIVELTISLVNSDELFTVSSASLSSFNTLSQTELARADAEALGLNEIYILILLKTKVLKEKKSVSTYPFFESNSEESSLIILFTSSSFFSIAPLFSLVFNFSSAVVTFLILGLRFFLLYLL